MNSSLTSATLSAAHSASSIDFSNLPHLTPSTSQASPPTCQPSHASHSTTSSHPTRPVLPYPSNLALSPSPLHLHCPAKDQLEQWLSHPDALSLLGSSVSLELQERIKTVTLQGWADSTRATYSAGLLVYHSFRDSREIPEKDHALANAALVSSFILALTGSLSGKAIHNYIYGVRAWHTLYGLPWVLHKDQISTMLKGAAKLAPPTVKQDKCRPVTTQMMVLIKDKLDLTAPFDRAFFTCLTTVFYSAAWVGEFTVPRLDSFNPAEHVTCRGTCDDTDRNGLYTKVFTLPRMKSSSTGEEVHWAKQDRPTDPLDAFNKHLLANDPPSGGPLFTYKTAKGLCPMTCQMFVMHLNKVAQAAGLS